MDCERASNYWNSDGVFLYFILTDSFIDGSLKKSSLIIV
jgi:hypothetical protein